MEKLTKTAKTLDKVFSIVYSVFTALAIAAAVCLGIMLMGFLFKWDPATYGTGFNSLDIGILEVELSESVHVNYKLVLLQGTIILALSCLCMLIGRQGIRYIRDILQPMTLGQPFAGAVNTNLKKLATLSIISGIATNLTPIVADVMTVFAFNLPDLMNPELVTHIGINYNLDLTFLLSFAILRLLSYVFHYGEELQKLSDETV